MVNLHDNSVHNVLVLARVGSHLSLHRIAGRNFVRYWDDTEVTQIHRIFYGPVSYHDRVFLVQVICAELIPTVVWTGGSCYFTDDAIVERRVVPFSTESFGDCPTMLVFIALTRKTEWSTVHQIDTHYLLPHDQNPTRKTYRSLSTLNANVRSSRAL